MPDALMPYYDYKCADCRQVFETERGMNDQSRPDCPACQSSYTQRVYFPVGFSISSGLAGPPAGERSTGDGRKSCGSCHSGVCSSCGSHG